MTFCLLSVISLFVEHHRKLLHTEHKVLFSKAKYFDVFLGFLWRYEDRVRFSGKSAV